MDCWSLVNKNQQTELKLVEIVLAKYELQNIFWYHNILSLKLGKAC